MRKILLLSTLTIVLLGGIIYIDSHTRLDNVFKKAGIVIQPPFNQLSINRDALSNLSVGVPSSSSHLIGAYYYMDDSNMYDYHFFTLNIFDLSYLFTEKGVKDEVYYGNYLNSTMKCAPKGSSPYRRLIDGTPAILYNYQKDMGDSLFIPTKVAVICCNTKAYYLEVSAIGNVDKWFDKIEQAISFRDFAKERRYSIAFMILLFIAASITLVFVVREVITFIKVKLKHSSKLFWTNKSKDVTIPPKTTKSSRKVMWINKSAHNLYRYIIAISVIDIIVALLFITVEDEFFGFVLITETLVKNVCMLFYLRKKAAKEYSEDYLVPRWFKNKFYKYLNNKAGLRIVLLFLYMPLFYIVPLPCGTLAIVFYIIPVCLLIGLYMAFRWIIAGKNESL